MGMATAVFAAENPDDATTGFFASLKERSYISGTLGAETGIETGDGDLQKFEGLLQLELEIELPKNIDLTIIPRMRVDLVDKLERSQPDQHEIGGFTRSLYLGDDVQLEMRELYFEAMAGDTFLTIGKQQVVWGKADGLKVLDVVNPQDFREFILDDFDDSRIPLWTINAEIPIGNATLQLLWIPDQTYHKIPEPGATYEFVSNVPQAPAGVSVVQNNFDRPNNIIGDSDVGLRISGFWKGWDLSLNYLYHYDDVPVLYRSLSAGPGGPMVTINPGYERTHLVGGTFSNAFGDLTLRGEFGFSFNKYYSTTDTTDIDGVHETDEFAYVIGLDWFGFSETLLSVQFFQNILADDAAGLLRDQVENTMSFLAQRDFRNDTFTVSNIWVHNFNDDDGFVRPKLEYKLRDDLDVWVGVDFFYGTQHGLYGQFDQTDRLILGLNWGF